MNRDTWNAQQELQRAIRSIRPLGKVLIRLKMINAWCNGDGISFLWNWYNPLTYIFGIPYILVFGLLSTIMFGVIETFSNISEFGLVKNSYWKENIDEIIPIYPSDLK